MVRNDGAVLADSAQVIRRHHPKVLWVNGATTDVVIFFLIFTCCSRIPKVIRFKCVAIHLEQHRMDGCRILLKFSMSQGEEEETGKVVVVTPLGRVVLC